MLNYFGIMLPSDVSFLQATTSCSSGVLRLFLVLLLLLLLHTEQIIIEFDWILNQQLTHICSLRPVNTIQETVSANMMFIVTLARQREAFAATSCDLSLKEKKRQLPLLFFFLFLSQMPKINKKFSIVSKLVVAHQIFKWLTQVYQISPRGSRR